MTWSIYAISEAQLQGKGCAAYTYLQRASEPYTRLPFFQFSEVLSDTALAGVSNPAFIFGLKPAFPFLTGAGGFLQVFTHGLTGMRPNLDAFTLDPTLPPQLADGVIVKGMKWQCAVFDVSIQLNITTITRRGDQRSCTGASKQANIRIRGKEYELAVEESLVVPTRRPDISSAREDLAMCKQVASNVPWAPGNYPFAIVDGSNSTIWQPATPGESSVDIDLGEVRKVARVVVDWAAVPPTNFSVSGSVDPGAVFEQLTGTETVVISAPYNAEGARHVRIGVGNMTEVALSEAVQLRFIRLIMQGSHAGDGLGATVAEVHVIGEENNDTAHTHTEKNASLPTDELLRL